MVILQKKKKRKAVHPFFVMVHHRLIDGRRHRVQSKEVKRIKKEEDFAVVNGPPQKIPPGIPQSRKILVCGAMGEVCVAIQNNSLRRAGYNTEIYKKATIYIEPLAKRA